MGGSMFNPFGKLSGNLLSTSELLFKLIDDSSQQMAGEKKIDGGFYQSTKKVPHNTFFVDCSVARWRFSPPDLQNSGGFESRLAGKKYFWRTPNFWRISGGFDQFCMVCFCLADSGGFEVCISKKKKLVSQYFLLKKLVDKK
jgi:hypothetical protein